MKIRQKLLIGFITVSLLVGVVGVMSLRTNNQIVNSFESGEEHFGSIITASTEVSSYVKRAQGHLMLYITLHNESDRVKFYDRISSLREQISLIEMNVKNPDAVKIVENIKVKTDELEAIGGAIIDAHDEEMRTNGRFNPGYHEELIRKLDTVAAGIREDGVSLEKIEIGLQDELNENAKKNAATDYYVILATSLLAVLGAMVLGYVLSRNIANPVIKLKEAANDIGRGNLGTKIEFDSKDEIGELADAINKMVLDLKISNDQNISAKEYTDNIVRSMTDTLIVISLDGTIRTANSAACMLLGYDEKELIGKPFDKVLANDEFLIIKSELARNYFIRSMEKTYVSKDLLKIPVIFSASVMLGNDGVIEGIVCLAQDITERKRAEERIREQAALLDNAHDAILVRDMGQRITYWNKGAEKLYGWKAEEAIGKTANDLLYRGSLPGFAEIKKSVFEESEWTGELDQVTKDGKEIVVESRWTLVRDESGYPRSILIINTDITAKKDLEARLLRAQRLESIGTLASGITHDINNVLSPIMLSFELLAEKFKDEESQKLISILERSTRRGASLIKQVQSFARGVEGERVVLQSAHIISEIGQLAKQTFPKSIEVRTRTSKDLWTIFGDATQLHQVIMNLCVNARDAMPDGGILGIAAENLFIDKNFAKTNIESKEGRYIVIAVSDTGMGIPLKIQERIFDPFFTTKEHGKGTGLGLSTAIGIVKSHGGFIDINSEVGKGSVFKVYLPAANSTEPQKTTELEITSSTAHGELILVVDDEASIRETTGSILKKCGYRVLTASDGAEALELFKLNGEAVKVVIMDMMMPVMDGPASVRAIRKLSPDVRIIVVSGLTDKEKLAKIADDNIQAYLPKPYTVDKLLKIVHEVLAAK